MFFARLFPALAACLLLLSPAMIQAQSGVGQALKIPARLVALDAATPGSEMLVAVAFTPEPGWHGYWKNPGDAGFGLTLDWALPNGWNAGTPEFPVPQRLVIGGLMNHVYKGDHAVLVPVRIPADAADRGRVTLHVDAEWLACADICIPQRDTLQLTVALGVSPAPSALHASWRAAIAPVMDRAGTYARSGDTVRLAIPVPATLDLPDPHVFVATPNVVGYAAAQAFSRRGDMLLVEMAASRSDGGAGQFEGLLAFGDGGGVAFTADAGTVPDGKGFEPLAVSTGTPSLVILLLSALAGGLLLNVMPCVFPILSLKALSLAKSSAGEQAARHEGLAYTAGVVLACLALGALLLALRAGGQQVGWAFQLQEPAVVVALFALAAAITANLAGLFELPTLARHNSGKPAGAFGTGVLAAIAATPCTGPFMAAALGAALLLPPAEALLLFGALGLGLALPFLAIGFVPALRRMLPKPGAWMERFRRAMAVPMGLTALALVWLLAQLGGRGFALVVVIGVFGLVVAFAIVGRLQRKGRMAWPAFALVAAPFVVFAAIAAPASYDSTKRFAAASRLDPVPYSSDALTEARATGQPVFLWFTADWCVTCKVNERVAIERAATEEAFAAAGVIAMRGDWSQPDGEIVAFLEQQGVAGIPLYVWYAPAGTAEILPPVLTPDTLVRRAKAVR